MSEAFLIDGEMCSGVSLAQAKATKKAIDDLNGKKLQQLIIKMSIANIATVNRDLYDLGGMTSDIRLGFVRFLKTCTYKCHESDGHVIQARSGELYTIKVLKTMEL